MGKCLLHDIYQLSNVPLLEFCIQRDVEIWCCIVQIQIVLLMVSKLASLNYFGGTIKKIPESNWKGKTKVPSKVMMTPIELYWIMYKAEPWGNGQNKITVTVFKKKLECFNEYVDMIWLQDGDHSQVEGVLSPPSPLGFVRMVVVHVHSSVHTGSSSDVFLSTLEFDGIHEIYLINTTRWKWHMWDWNQLHGALTPDSIFWMCWSESEPQR